LRTWQGAQLARIQAAVLNTAFADDDDDDEKETEDDDEEQEVKRSAAVLTREVLPSQIFRSHRDDEHDGCCHPECNAVQTVRCTDISKYPAASIIDVRTAVCRQKKILTIIQQMVQGSRSPILMKAVLTSKTTETTRQTTQNYIPECLNL
jgi:hypothetical protein